MGKDAHFAQIDASAVMPFAGNPLDRAGARRTDPVWLAAQLRGGLALPFWRNKPLVIDGRAGFLPWRETWNGQTCVLLGLEGAQALFAVDVPGESEPDMGGGAFAEMRASAFVLPARDTAIAGQAKALIDWHGRHGFCANCGAKTEMRDGGYRRLCLACGAEHFPRTDPVVIMLPVLGDHCLVGRNARFANGLYSAFAGFVEPGESLEDAVRRELTEEAGVKIGAVRYHASQPWPFPSSLMLGCYAQALDRDFQIDDDEIVDARWLSRNEARQRLAGAITDNMTMPAPIAIAHHLIKGWANG